jgi:hypothetical protein
MAIDPTISLGIKVPEVGTNLSRLTNLSAQQLDLQKARDTYSADVAQRKSESALAGTHAKIAEATAPDVIQQQQTAAHQALLSLNDAERKSVGTFIAAQAGNEPKVVRSKLDALAELQPNLKPVVDFMWNSHLAPVEGDPKAFGAAVKTIGLATQTVPEQYQTRTPGGPMVGNGQVTQMINTNPGADTAVGAPVAGTMQQQQLPPGTVAFNPQTNAPQYVGAGGQGGPQAAPALGAPEQIQENQREVQSIRSAGDQVPVQRNINQSILRLSRDTASGPGTPAWQRALSAISLGNFGDNYQELGKYLEKNAIANMSAMGGTPSDARLQAAAAANGSTSFNPGALQEVTKFNDATTTAIEKYRQGVDRAVGLRNGDVNALPEFKAAWTKNLDPNVFRVENAIRDGDTMELQRLKKELGSDGLKKLAEKRKALESLSATGRIQ